MKTTLATWLMTLAIAINGGPVEPVETEPAIIPDEVITETVMMEQIIPEEIIVEDSVTDELEGEPLIFDDIKDSRLYQAFQTANIAVADKATVIFGNAEEVMSRIGDRLIFWD